MKVRAEKAQDQAQRGPITGSKTHNVDNEELNDEDE